MPKKMSQFDEGHAFGDMGYDLDANNNGGQPLNAPNGSTASKGRSDFQRGANKGYADRVYQQANRDMTSGTDEGLAKGIAAKRAADNITSFDDWADKEHPVK